jgi:type II secretory pathway pseudopilin PulG
MSRKIPQAGHKAFFSLDASLALLIAALSYALLSTLFLSAAQGASSSATSASMRLLSLRLSSFILDEAGAEAGGDGGSAYLKPGEISASSLQQAGIEPLRTKLGLRFASLSVFSQEGLEYFSQSGEKGEGGVFCTSRLALFSRKISRLEVCIS